MSSLQVDPAVLRSTSGSFASVSTSVAAALTELQSAIEAEGECWGNDEIGESFAESYTPGVGDGSTGIGALATVLEKLGDGVVTIAAAFEDLDEERAGELSGLDI